MYSGVDQAALTAGILIDVGTRLTDIGARNPAIDEDDPTIVHIELPTVIEGESVTIRIAADLFTDAHDNPNNGGQTFTKTIQAQVRGVVRTLAGQLRVRNNGDGDNVNGAEATLGEVNALIADENNIYVADFDNGSIRKIDKFGAVSTIISGLRTGVRYRGPKGLALHGTDLYVSTEWNFHIIGETTDRILKFDLSNLNAGDSFDADDGTVVAGDNDSTTGRIDGIGENASFYNPGALAINSKGTALYV